MFDIGAPELFIVAVLAIIVVGPKDLPKLIRSVMGMIRKVKEMGSEFQAGVKKMADEVELDTITRKLNEAGNIKLDDTKPAVDTSAENSDYAEFDYDDYDYDNDGYIESIAEKKDDAESSEEKPQSENKSESEDGNEDTVDVVEDVSEEPVEADISDTVPDIIEDDVEDKVDEAKSKTND